METENTRRTRGLDELEGELISGRYKIMRRIGKGGMGVVYLAQQTNLDRNVCIKVLNPALLDDEDAVGRFEREARGLSRLKHPNIVTIYDYGRDGNLAYIVMEYAQGETLGKFLKARGALPIDTFLPIAVQTLKGIGEAHKMGLIHRDIKPANIVLCELEGERNFVKILDFGLAKLAQGSEDLTKEQQLVGSASYMSPEQILSGISDTRTDVYALGVMFYLMLAGKKPFTGANDNAILYHHVNTIPSPLSTLVQEGQNVPETLCEVIDQCLSKDPEKRPQTAIDLLTAISYALDAPQLRAGYSSMSLARIELQKVSEDAETHFISQPQAHDSIGNLSAVSAVTPGGVRSDYYNENSMSGVSFSMTPVPPGVDPTHPISNQYPMASIPNNANKERRFLIVGVIGAVVVVIILVAVLLSLHKDGPDEPKEVIAVQDAARLVPVYEQIEEKIAQGLWDDAEKVISELNKLPEAQTPENLTKVSDYDNQIKAGKALAEAREARDNKQYQLALEKYNDVIKREPENGVALEERNTLQAQLDKMASVSFNFVNINPAATELFIDNQSMGTPTEAPIPVQTGRHTIKITSPGYQDMIKEIDFTETSNHDLAVELKPVEAAPVKTTPKPSANHGHSSDDPTNIFDRDKKKKSGNTKDGKKKIGLQGI